MRDFWRIATLLLAVCPLAASGAVPPAVVPASPIDLPQRAKLQARQWDGQSAKTRKNEEGVERSLQPFENARDGTPVFVLRRLGGQAAVLAADGRFGYVEENSLYDAQTPSPADIRAVAAAMARPERAAKLNPAQKQLLQASFALYLLREGDDNESRPEGERDPEHVRADRELALLSVVAKRRYELAYPVLLQRWLEQVESRISYDYEYPSPEVIKAVTGEHYLVRRVFPRLSSADGAGDRLAEALCRRFGQYPQDGRRHFGFNTIGSGGDHLFLALIRELGRQTPLSPCLINGLKKIAAYNLFWGGGPPMVSESEPALDLLREVLGKAATEQWLLSLLTAKTPPENANLALALTKWRDIELQPVADRLYQVARPREADGGDGGADLATRLALKALARRGAPPRLRTLLEKWASNANGPMLPRLDALKLLGELPPSASQVAALAKVLTAPATDATDPRPAQVAAEALAGDALRPLAVGVWRRALDHGDAYVRHLALGVARDQALAEIKAAKSPAARDEVRGRYLLDVRQRVEALRQVTAGLELKPSPQWMIKPAVTVGVSLRQTWNAENFVPRLIFEAPPQADFVARYQRDASPPTERQAAMVEPLTLHPGRAVMRATAAGAATMLKVQVALDALTVDGRPVVDPARPGIYALTLGDGEGGVLFHVAWYCEPDPAFWSDAGLE